MSTPNTLVIDKTPYINILEKTPMYQCMLLRPRGWGKSTFLRMLADYYDVNKADKFDETFGHLSIGKESRNLDRSSLLVLILDFSCVDFEDLQKTFFKVLRRDLKIFVGANAVALGNPAPQRINDDDGEPSLQAVLVSAKRTDYLLTLLTESFRTL